jgi:hypothetical protein
MRILVLLLVLVAALARPNVRFQFEKAREKLYNIPPPQHDHGLATRVTDCIAGKIRDPELCSHSVVKFTNHIQDMYTRAAAIYQAEDAGRAALIEAEQEAEAQTLTKSVEPVDTTKIPVKPRD